MLEKVWSFVPTNSVPDGAQIRFLYDPPYKKFIVDNGMAGDRSLSSVPLVYMRTALHRPANPRLRLDLSQVPLEYAVNLDRVQRGAPPNFKLPGCPVWDGIRGDCGRGCGGFCGKTSEALTRGVIRGRYSPENPLCGTLGPIIVRASQQLSEFRNDYSRDSLREELRCSRRDGAPLGHILKLQAILTLDFVGSNLERFSTRINGKGP